MSVLRRTASFVLVTACAVASAACGGAAAPTDATALLAQSKGVVDTTRTIHFKLTSANVQGNGVQLTGGDGNAVRPNSFSGVLTVTTSGIASDVSVISTGGVFYAKLPFSSTFAVTDPTLYGFGDPAMLLDPDKGLSNVLTSAKKPTLGASDRLNGEELDEVSAAIPGELLAKLLTSADAAQDVQMVVGIARETHEVRRIVLTGPFFDAKQKSTFTLFLDKYGVDAAVTPPPKSPSK